MSKVPHKHSRPSKSRIQIASRDALQCVEDLDSSSSSSDESSKKSTNSSVPCSSPVVPVPTPLPISPPRTKVTDVPSMSWREVRVPSPLPTPITVSPHSKYTHHHSDDKCKFKSDHKLVVIVLALIVFDLICYVATKQFDNRNLTLAVLLIILILLVWVIFESEKNRTHEGEYVGRSHH